MRPKFLSAVAAKASAESYVGGHVFLRISIRVLHVACMPRLPAYAERERE